jgi:hypothetical protein
MESRKPAFDVSCARLFRMGRVRHEVGCLAAGLGVEFSGRLFGRPFGEPSQRGAVVGGAGGKDGRCSCCIKFKNYGGNSTRSVYRMLVMARRVAARQGVGLSAERSLENNSLSRRCTAPENRGSEKQRQRRIWMRASKADAQVSPSSANMTSQKRKE